MTAHEVERRLAISDRHVWNAIHEMIQRDPVKALVELITNADDSYARLEAAGGHASGRIVVEVEERRGDASSVLRVRDDAEGFTLTDLDREVGRMGEATSRLEVVAGVRGMWGDGLKEALLGLGGGGRLVSVRGGLEVEAALWWGAEQEPLYGRPGAPRPVTPDRRAELDLPGDGTVVEVEVGPGVTLPRHARLVHDLGLHFALRDIVGRPERTVLVRRVRDGHVRHEDRVTWREPVTDPDFSVDEKWPVPGWPGATFRLSLRRSDEPLTGPEAGPYRLSGLIVQSRGALVDVGWFGAEGRPGAEHLFGRVVCDALHERLQQGDLTLTRNRTGLDRDNPFSRALVQAVAARADRWLDAEEARAPDAPLTADPWLRRRVPAVLAVLNDIVLRERRRAREAPVAPLRFEPARFDLRVGEEVTGRLLADEALAGAVAEVTVDGAGVELVGPTAGPTPLAVRLRGVAPARALVHARCPGHETTAAVTVRAETRDEVAFDAASWRVEAGRTCRLALRARPDGAVALRAVRGELVVVEPPRVTGRDDGWTLLEAFVRGDRAGTDDVLVATRGDVEARAAVRVVARRAHAGPAGPLSDLRLDDRPEPPRRHQVDDHGVLTVFTDDRSLRRYLHAPEDRSSAAGRAILAEVVLEALGEYLVGQGWAHATVAGADPVMHALRLYEQLLHEHGDRVHAALAPHPAAAGA